LKRFIIKCFAYTLPIIGLGAVLYFTGYLPLTSDSISFDAKVLELKKIRLKHADIIAIGSSTCLNNLNSNVISDSLSKSYYNFGAWQLQIEDLDYLVKSYVAIYKPKYVLLPSNFADFELKKDDFLPDNLNSTIDFLPIFYVENYANLRQIVERKKHTCVSSKRV